MSRNLAAIRRHRGITCFSNTLDIHEGTYEEAHAEDDATMRAIGEVLIVRAREHRRRAARGELVATEQEPDTG